MPSFGALGESLSAAQASGFFRWFTLEQTGASSPVPGRQVTHHRPNGPAFRDLTEVLLTATDRGELTAVELRLSRDFIEHPHNGLFARDIAKSLLRDAMPRPDAWAIADIANEIEFPRHVEVPVLTARQVDVPLPVVPTSGYEVYLGRRGRFDLRGAVVDLVLENYLRETARWFRMAVAARS
ncbi:MAG: hypothetical protein HOP28_09820 [Gemmatimonadales bacterium]|nr:hypothetical protein [Gemmatimonadales bacterium]